MHEIKRLWVRPEKGGAVVPVDRIELQAGSGVVGDHKFEGRRHVTIVFEGDWAAAVEEVGTPVDPSARRANVLVSGADGRRFVDRTIHLGETVIEVKGIVAPCARMDEAEPGLRKAMEPDGRGGIWGQVVTGGVLRPGDLLS